MFVKVGSSNFGCLLSRFAYSKTCFLKMQNWFVESETSIFHILFLSVRLSVCPSVIIYVYKQRSENGCNSIFSRVERGKFRRNRQFSLCVKFTYITNTKNILKRYWFDSFCSPLFKSFFKLIFDLKLNLLWIFKWRVFFLSLENGCGVIPDT